MMPKGPHTATVKADLLYRPMPVSSPWCFAENLNLLLQTVQTASTLLMTDMWNANYSLLLNHFGSQVGLTEKYLCFFSFFFKGCSFPSASDFSV